MKLLLVICAAIVMAQAMSDEDKQKIMAQKKVCIAQEKVPDDLAAKILSGQHDMPSDATMNAFTYCMVTSLGIVDGEGKINKEHVMEMVDDDHEDDVWSTVESCVKDIGDKVTKDNAYSFCQCIHKNPNVATW